MIYFIRPDTLDKVGELGAIGKVSVMEKKPGSWLMGVNIDVVYPGGTEGARPSDDAVNLVAFIKQELSKIRAVLARDACNKCLLHGTLLI
jgi:hypothetical protein